MESLLKYPVFIILKCAHFVRDLFSHSEDAYKLLLIPGLEGVRWNIGKWKAWMVFEKARKTTPAYKKFLQAHPNARVKLINFIPDLSLLPITDKESYIKKFSIEDRCINGKIPSRGVVIDESSGTSGTPNNWVRGPVERNAVKQALQIAFHNQFGNKPIFLINAFALGPWATGMNVSMSMVDVVMLKSTGPDIQKIVNTLNLFGPKYSYVITGYPPFLKALADNTQVDWEKFDIITIFGGEGMSEGMRDYLSKAFKQSYGSYGASDLEINIAAETDFTIKLRKLLIHNQQAHDLLVRYKNGVLPVIFQYNPLDYFIETNEEGELVVTLCRESNTSPKIRYNIHDTGYVVRMPELKKALRELGITDSQLKLPENDLPLLFHFGRADMAVAYYGCKITPENIKEVTFALPNLARIVNSFTIITYEDDKVDKKLVLAFELEEGKTVTNEAEKFYKDIFENLKKINQDYREASKMVPENNKPKLEFYSIGTGPFKVNDIRLKKHYIQVR